MSNRLNKQEEPIAIVGIACRFPGGMNTLESFWDVLISKKDVVGEFPKDRVPNIDNLIDPGRTPGKIISRSGGFLEKIDEFDAGFFRISPKEAEKIDPQQRILLELTYEAMEDAGIKMEEAWGSRTGVFAGVWTSDYEHRMLRAGHDIDVYATTGTGRYGASGRISYIFNFQGPCMSLDTACSSSIVAVHLAVQSLLSGESNLAVAAAANLIIDSFISVGYSRSGLLAPYGRCRFGSQEPRGYVRSEGAAVVLMKRLSQAIEDGDNIYALVTGTSCNSDGQSHKYMLAPSFITQETLIRDAVKRAGIQAKDIQYVEAHGTGTKAGDPAELRSIPSAICDDRVPGDKFYVGSIKTNIGHTEPVAGLAALIKTTLAFQHRIIPASLYSDEPNRNPDIPWESLPLEIPTEAVPWPHPDKPLIAGVNSFGISGINAHAIMQEAPEVSEQVYPFDHEYMVLPVSAAAEKALVLYVKEYLAFLEQHTPGKQEMLNWIRNISFRKSGLAERVAFLGRTDKELVDAMQAWLSGTPHEGVVTGQALQDLPVRTVAVFPGQGSQWPGMGKELYSNEPVFRQAILACEAAFGKYADWKLTDELFKTGNDALSSIDIIQPAIVAIEIATARLLESWGLSFDAVVGHSMGEAASAYLSGAISLDETANIICTRSRLMKRTSGQGAMGYIGLPAEEVAAAIQGKESLVGIGVVNSPQSAVISGDPATVDKILAEFEAKGAFCRRVKVDVASHSPQMEPLIPELEQALSGLLPGDTNTTFYSTVLDRKVPGQELDKQYWVKNLRNQVKFGATIQHILEDGHSVFVECSPHPILVQPIQENIQSVGAAATAHGSMQREQSESLSMAKALGQAWCNGAHVQWKQYYGPNWQRVSLPLYPWQKERYWFDESQSGIARQDSVRRDGTTGHPLLSHAVDLGKDAGIFVWETAVSLQAFPFLAGHKVGESIIFPAAAYLEMMAAAAKEVFDSDEYTWENIELRSVLAIPEKGAVSVQINLIRTIGDAYAVTIKSWQPSEDGGQWSILAVATLIVNAGQQSLLPEADHWKKKKGEQILGAAQHYEATAIMGLPYEGAFTGLQQIEIAGDVIKASVLLDSAVQTNRYFYHPALLDGCIQAMLQPMYAKYPQRTIVPVSMGKWRQVSWDKGLNELSIVMHVTQNNATAVVCDAVIYAGKDKLVAEWKGFKLAALDSSTAGEQPLEDMLYTTAWHPIDIQANYSGKATILFFAPDSKSAMNLEKALGKDGHTCLTVLPGEDYASELNNFRIRPLHTEDYARLWDELQQQPIDKVVFAWPLAADRNDPVAAQQITSMPFYKLVQALSKSGIKHPLRLWVWTAGGRQVLPEETVNPAAAPVWGMVNVLLNEHPELKTARIDLPEHFTIADLSKAADVILSATPENELALRNESWLAARLEHLSAEAHTTKPAALIRPEGKQYIAVTTQPGLLDNLTLREILLPDPGKEEVQVAVHAAGINFMNLMSALGIYPGKENGFATLGLEFAGIVTSVGSNITAYKAGDAVLGMGYDTVASHINVDARKLCPVPAGMSMEDAAGIPVVYLTCWYALVRLAQLSKGERVLIHAATGGVGLAAIQIARFFGAEILATAGSEEKREVLRQMGIPKVYDSRSLDFYEQILKDTAGEGVDVVLNSLTGEAMHRSIQLLRKYGRFLEIGKKDVYGNSRLGMEDFGRSLSYHMIDLEMLSFDKPALIGGMLNEILALFAAGHLSAMSKTVFPLSDLKNAFAFMSKSHHVGKIILDVRDKHILIEPVQKNGLLVRQDATYLLTGGYGGLGLTFAAWLTDRGARHLILTGRSGPKGKAAEAVEALRQRGVQVEIATPDLEKREEVAALLTSIPADRPLLGIMHFAGLLDDAAMVNITDEQYQRVTGPKIAGVWNLHLATKALPVDWFVLPSSSTILFGSPGQAAYVAANSFLDALSQYRHQMDLPAQSIQWGTVAGVGLAAAESNRLDRLAEEGVAPLDTTTCIDLYEQIAERKQPVTGAFSFDLSRWEQTYGTAAHNPFFSLLREGTFVAARAEASFRDHLLTLPDPGERLLLIEERLKEKVGQVVKMDPEKIANKTPFKSLGIDSLMSIQLKNQLEKAFDLSISVTSFWTHANIRDYSIFLAEELSVHDNGAEIIMAKESPATIASPMNSDNDMPDMDDLSSDDLSKLLEEELKDL
jgi:phthiocerol/phenolphthiocerol synthesis type-I polyketide synthase C